MNKTVDKRKVNIENIIIFVSLLIIVVYFFAHTIMKSVIANYNLKYQKIETQVAQLNAEYTSLDKERQQLVDTARVAEIAKEAGYEYQASRRYIVRVDTSN